MGGGISEIKRTKNSSYLVTRKLVENFIVTTAYADVAKPMNNLTPNQGMAQ